MKKALVSPMEPGIWPKKISMKLKNFVPSSAVKSGVAADAASIGTGVHAAKPPGKPEKG